MAYGTKYHIGWSSPARQQLTYDIDILQRDYDGETREAHLTGEGVVITYGAYDDDELKPIKASSARLSLMCESDDCDFSELYTEDPLMYQVRVTECRDLMCVMRWVGYISTGSYTRPLGHAPFVVEVEANDGFEVLMNTPYRASRNMRYADTLSIRELIQRLISPISTRTIDLWGIPAVMPAQEVDSSDVVGVAADAIYNAFDEDVPSHYDVLEAVLRNFGLQAYFEGQRLVVRAVSALGTMTRPEWLNSADIALGSHASNALPLYSDDPLSGEGISSTATMSMLPPISTMEVEEGDRESHKVYSMLSPSRWQSHAYKRGVNGGLVVGVPKVYEGVRGIRLGIDAALGDNSDSYAVLSYVFDGQLNSTNSSVITFDATFYPLLTSTQRVRMVFFAVPTTMDPTSWMDAWRPTGAATNYEIAWYLPAGIRVYGAGFNRWDALPAEYNSVAAIVRGYAKTISLGAATKPIPFYGRQVLEDDLKVDVHMNILRVPEGGPYRLVMVLVGDPMVFAAEIVNPTLAITAALGVEQAEAPTSYAVSQYGSDSVTYSQHFIERGIQSPISNLVEPSVIEVATEKSVTGYVSPAHSSSMRAVMASRLRGMRNKVTRQLDGEIYTPHATTLSTMWRDRDGRIYYTNYLRLLLKRGLVDAQLREMLPLTQQRYTNIDYFYLGTFACGDNVALITNGEERYALYAYRPYDSSITLLEDFTASSGQVSVHHGIGSMIARVDHGERCELRAYDDSLGLLAVIDNLYSAGVPDVGENIYYDAVTSTWVCAYVDTSRVTVAVLEKSGALMTTQSYDYDSLETFVPMASGFVMTVAKAGARSVVWHSHEYHQNLDVESIDTNGGSIVGVNDIYVVVYGRDKIARMYARQAGALSFDLSAPLFVAGTKYTFASMNCALVMFKNTVGDVVIFDGRTGLDIPYHGEVLGAGTKHLLIGDTIYGWYDTYIDAHKIIEGDGYADAVDFYGNTLYTSDDMLCRVKKYNGYE